MPLARRNRLLIALAAVGLVALLVLSQVVRVWWFRGYSKGTRTGYVRKLSEKGPPYCKYVSGELVMVGTAPGVPSETWEFSVDDEDAKGPVMAALHDAEKSGARVTVQYRQDLHALYRCTPSEYFITGLEK